MKGKLSRLGGVGCLVLFALPFAGVGVFMGYRAVASLSDWAAMRSWVEVDALIESAGLAVSEGDDSTTYAARATYRYTYDGAEYTGSRVGIEGGFDNVGSFHERAYEELNARRGEVFRCFVNPDDPSESILYRDLRWEMLAFHLLFVIVFGGVGFGLMIGALYGSRKLERDEELAALHPDEPWLQKDEWQTGRIRSSGKAAFVGSLAFAGLWNAISLPAVYFVYQAIRGEEEPQALIAGIFPLVGLGLAFWALRNGLRYRKYGDSVLELGYIPGVIGGPFAGTIRTRARTPALDVTLSAARVRRTGSGKNRSTRETITWQRKARFAYDRSLGGVPVSFHVPYDCQPTDESDDDDKVVWTLTAEADTPGVDYHASFEVPVFRTEHSSDRPPEPADVAAGAARVEIPLDQRIHQAGGRMEDFAGGRRFVFPMARQIGLALGLTGFFLVWSGIVVALRLSDAPGFFFWIFAFFDVLLLLGVLEMWLEGSRIELRHGSLAFSSGWFGGGRLRSLRPEEIDKLEPKRGMQSGSQVYYQLELTERGGKTHAIAKRLPELETAERLIQEIDHRLGRTAAGF